jgi:plastocyanin
MKRFVSQYSQRFRPLWVILTVIVVMALALVAWGGSTTTAVASTKVPSLGLKRGHVVHTVKIMEMNGRFFFQPSRMTIKVGDIVVWKNVTVASHTVSSDTGVFNTPSFLSPNGTFTFTFNRSGTFKYHCNIHLYMHAAIIVKSALPSNQSNPTSPPPSMPTPTPRSGGGGYGGGMGGGY